MPSLPSLLVFNLAAGCHGLSKSPNPLKAGYAATSPFPYIWQVFMPGYGRTGCQHLQSRRAGNPRPKTAAP